MCSNFSNVDKNVLDEITEKVDLILDLCQKDVELHPFAFKFQFEQAADKAAFQPSEDTKLLKMERVLQQMIDLARDVASYVLNRTITHSKRKTDQKNISAEETSNEIIRVNSVDDFTAGGDSWLECGANVSLLCSSVLSLVILASKNIQRKVQLYLLHQNILEYVNEALKISKEHEVSYFLEGHRTELLRLLANMSFENTITSIAMSENDELLINILSSTRIDEENPGVGEWAKFAIRNICHAAESAREKIKKLQPLEVAPDSKAMLPEGYSCKVSLSGGCRISKDT